LYTAARCNGIVVMTWAAIPIADGPVKHAATSNELKTQQR